MGVTRPGHAEGIIVMLAVRCRSFAASRAGRASNVSADRRKPSSRRWCAFMLRAPERRYP
jgi:hypothetical protein